VTQWLQVAATIKNMSQIAQTQERRPLFYSKHAKLGPSHALSLGGAHIGRQIGVKL